MGTQNLLKYRKAVIPTAERGYNICMERECKVCKVPCRELTPIGYTYKIRCPDCGKVLLKITEDTRGTLIAWCKECREEKTIQL
jgi:hypothetical protein